MLFRVIVSHLDSRGKPVPPGKGMGTEFIVQTMPGEIPKEERKEWERSYNELQNV